MPKISIIYGTSEGQTRKIAEYMASVIEQNGHSAVVVDCSRVSSTFSMQDYDAALIGASMHVGRFQDTVREFVRSHLEQLQRIPSAFFSVSLTAASRKAQDQAQVRQSVTTFQKETGWRPHQVACIAGALKYSRYGIAKRWIMKRIAKQTSGDLDTSRDYEYTNWGAVKLFVEDFLSSLAVAV
jgi:menaquinone-dependent protoporphyrinogen oxidase